MAPARLLLATTLLAIAATSDDVHAAKLMCTDAKFAAEYAAIQNKMSACQAATGIALVLPLPAKKKTTLCEKCTELAATAGARGFPKCNVIADGESIPLNQQFVRLFRPCVAAANATPSPAGGDDDDDTPAKPASPSPSGGDNNTPATTTTPMPAATPTPAKSSGSHGSGKADSASTTPQPSKTPKPRKTPKASKAPKHPGNATTVVASIDASHADDIDDDDTVDSAAVDSSSSAAASSSGTRTFAGGDITSSATNDTISKTTSAAASTTSTGMIVGIVAGIVAVALPPPSSSAAVPFQFGPAASTTSAGGRHLPSLASSVDLSTSESPSTASSSLLAPARHPSLWEDHAIVAARIPRDKVLAITLVSRGGFGEVHQGIYNHQRMMTQGRLRVQFTEAHAPMPEIVELGNACVALDPRNRPSAATVMWTLHRLLKSTYVVM
ncbi:hypothetical protein PybrP1_001939 [[Pythium] brassicae (nom. inval.)]|nr:hypothetical protein PybrP1_001939 [[Pythium] brassicae (nom. inval.)]